MIVEYPNFLTEQECQWLISYGECSNLRPGFVEDRRNGYRKAKISWLDENEIVEKIKSDISQLTGIDVEKQERLHFVKYISGGEYKEHLDGASRQKTALIYLNVGFKGGETTFPKLNKIIKPETGKLIVWDNIDDKGNEDSNSLHAGLPVEFGTKYIAVIWIKK
jgi:prolyl 4-hydroxylase